MTVQFTLLRKGNNFAQLCEKADIEYYRDTLGYKVVEEKMIETDDPAECEFDTGFMKRKIKSLNSKIDQLADVVESENEYIKEIDRLKEIIRQQKKEIRIGIINDSLKEIKIRRF